MEEARGKAEARWVGLEATLRIGTLLLHSRCERVPTGTITIISGFVTVCERVNGQKLGGL